MNTLFFWLSIGLIFLILELTNPGLFFFLSFCFGAFAAALTTHSLSLINQIWLFFALSGLSFSVLYLLFSHKQKGGIRTNSAALEGRRAIVIEDIAPGKPGFIKIGGEIWLAKAHDNGHYLQGVEVEIIAVVGCHCIIKSTHR